MRVPSIVAEEPTMSMCTPAFRVRPVLLIAAIVVTGAAAASAQQDFSNVQVASEKVAGAVHMLSTGIAGNIGVSAGPDGILIVDDQFAPLADKIRSALQAIAPGDLEFVVNTHWHGDHTGGNEVFGREAVIVAHTNVRKRLMTGASGEREVPPAPAVALPVITYDDGVSVHFNGEEIRVVHLPPGHTDGDSYVHFTGSNVVHLGDDFFSGRFPYVDLASGGSPEGLRDNIGRLLGELPADVRIIPGHGPLSTIDDLRAYHEMLVDTIDQLKTAKAAGRTLDEVKAAGFGERWASWSWSFITTERWAEIVYRSLP
ncbi:MAG TPA: MBL fold metallo-hydrolase [Thermoanaerobaculia bacterium]|nr:MBL fold metallo-hydrolase [Thermoanaerobaculia bacterium]